MMRVFFFTLLPLSIWTLVQMGCQFGFDWSSSKGPSVLILAVDSLPVDQINCEMGTEQKLKGFSVLCEQSVRFTHAYTTSTLQQPALASLFTARYPFELGLWHNGDQFLSAQYRTLAEELVGTGVRTSFFSGGAPIWSKSGLNQGFETFDDQVSISWKKYYRRVEENLNLFVSWLEGVGPKRFFSTIYIPDLQFPSQVTVSHSGRLREKTYRGQLEEVSESLEFLWKSLKKMNRWEETIVVLVGLNGLSEGGRWNEVKGSNLFSENSQVALLIKPASKKRDKGLNWKVDDNVSLVDLGAYLFDVMGAPRPRRQSSSFEVSSLRKYMENKSSSKKDRVILTESAWGQWRQLGESRFSLRQGPFLYLHEEPPRLYNSFVDYFEISPLSSGDRVYKGFLKKVSSLLQSQSFPAWDLKDKNVLQKYYIASQIFAKGSFDQNDYRDIRALSLKFPEDRQVASWLALFLLERQDWLALKKLGQRWSNIVWEAVAQIHLKEISHLPQQGCLRVLTGAGSQKPFLQCQDELLIRFSQWINEKNKSKRAKKKEIFISSYIERRMDIEIGHLSFRSGLSWDIDMDQDYGVSDVDLILSLPQYKSYQFQVKARLKSFKRKESFF